MPSQTFRVEARWRLDTGLYVPAHTVVYIHQVNLADRWITNPDKHPTDANGFKYAGRDGLAQDDSTAYGQDPLGNPFYFGALIAGVSGSPWYWIGVRGSAAAGQSGGNLILTADDDRSGYDDNTGYIDFEVSFSNVVDRRSEAKLIKRTDDMVEKLCTVPLST